MSVETLTYAALGARLKISPVAARRLPSDCACRAHFRSKAWCIAIRVLSFPSSMEQL